MEYRVYVRFEDTPAIARENSEQQPDPEYGPFILESVGGADPGQETPILHEALESARQNGKFVALYRGRQAGRSRYGAELFVPLGLAWCKDSFELAQMLGVELDEEKDEDYRDEARRTPTEEELRSFSSYQRSNRSQQAKSATYQADNARNEAKSPKYEAEYREHEAERREYQAERREYEAERGSYSQPADDFEDDGTESAKLTPRERFQQARRGKEKSSNRGQSTPTSRGWLAWTGIIVGSFVGAFIVVYAVARLLGL